MKVLLLQKLQNQNRPTDAEIIARVTQTQLDVAEHDDENEEDDVDWEMLPPRRDQVRQAIEILH